MYVTYIKTTSSSRKNNDKSLQHKAKSNGKKPKDSKQQTFRKSN